MYKPLIYVLTEVMKHNVGVFSTRTCFCKAWDINIPGVILKCLAIHDHFKKNLKTDILISLINPISGIKYLNDCDRKTYSSYVEDREINMCILEAHTIGHPA